jgi:hypothetical protein
MNKDLTEVYQIKVRGRPDARWSSWFGGMTITYEIESDGVPAAIPVLGLFTSLLSPT